MESYVGCKRYQFGASNLGENTVQTLYIKETIDNVLKLGVEIYSSELINDKTLFSNALVTVYNVVKSRTELFHLLENEGKKGFS